MDVLNSSTATLITLRSRQRQEQHTHTHTHKYDTQCNRSRDKLETKEQVGRASHGLTREEGLEPFILAIAALLKGHIPT